MEVVKSAALYQKRCDDHRFFKLAVKLNSPSSSVVGTPLSVECGSVCLTFYLMQYRIYPNLDPCSDHYAIDPSGFQCFMALAPICRPASTDADFKLSFIKEPSIPNFGLGVKTFVAELPHDNYISSLRHSINSSISGVGRPQQLRLKQNVNATK
jgi:hypothetical protein